MNLTAKLNLQATPEQAQALLGTLEAANKVCNEIGQQAWKKQVFTQSGLHRLVYNSIRVRHNLAAQMIVRAIARVANAYQKGQKHRVTFSHHDALAYDPPIVSFDLDTLKVSLWSVKNRLNIPFACSDRAMELLHGRRRESYLCYIDEQFYLFVSCEVETPDARDVEEIRDIR